METEPTEYAGFWLRFVAYLIDGIILSFVEFVMVIPFLGLLGYNVAILESLESLESADMNFNVLIPIMISAFLGLSLSIFLISWLYYALMESGPRQGTIGKLALGLTVTNMDGDRINFATASLRYFGKIISGAILMLGYIMAGFTLRKQALHDIIANTLVLRK